jgi:metallo-beta-lactamase family protein
MHISFLGAAGEVTGSCYLVRAGRTRFLVDCGLFQGSREAQRINLAALNFDDFSPKAIDFVLLAHVHLDHSGLLSRLYALGYRGPAFATVATCELLMVLLLEAAHIQEKEAERLNRRHQSRQVRCRAGQASFAAQSEAPSVLGEHHGVSGCRNVAAIARTHLCGSRRSEAANDFAATVRS